MKLHYYKETGSFYIDLNSKKSNDSIEVTDGLVLDLDENKNVVGIDIQNASKILDLDTLETVSLPIIITKMAS